MKTIKTHNNIELIVVEVPEDTLKDRWFIVYNVKRNSFSVEFQTNKDNIYVDLKTDKDCYILDKLSKLSEEECSRFVKKGGIGTYKDYCYNLGKIDKIGVFGALLEMKFKTAKKSLISLIQSEGVDINKELLIIEKI